MALQGQSIKTLEAQNDRLGELLGAALAGQQALPKLIENLVERIATGVPDPVAEVGTVSKMFGPSPTLDQIELVREQLDVARARDPKTFKTFAGNVTASDLVEVEKGGIIGGDIKAPRVIMHDGAIIVGGLDMSAALPNGTSADRDDGDEEIRPHLASVAPIDEDAADESPHDALD